MTEEVEEEEEEEEKKEREGEENIYVVIMAEKSKTKNKRWCKQKEKLSQEVNSGFETLLIMKTDVIE